MQLIAIILVLYYSSSSLSLPLSSLSEDNTSNRVKSDNFERALYMVEDNIKMLKDIVKKKQNKSIKFKDGTMRVDLMTASTITQVYDKVNDYLESLPEKPILEEEM